MGRMIKACALLAMALALSGQVFAQDFSRPLVEFQSKGAARASTRATAQGMTWEQIVARFIPDWPVMPFEGYTLSIYDLCHAGGSRFELRGAKKTVEVCRDNGYDEYRCLRSEEVRVSIPAMVEYEDCPDSYERDGCDNPVKVTFVRLTTYQVGVYERGVDEDRVALFTKSYTIPACK